MDAIELAFTVGTPGDAYFILDNGTRSLHDMISAMARAANIDLPKSRFHTGLLRLWPDLVKRYGAACV